MPEYSRKELLALNDEDFRSEVVRALTTRVKREYSQLVADVFAERWNDRISEEIGGRSESPESVSFGLVSGATPPAELTGRPNADEVRRALIDHLESAGWGTIDERANRTAEFSAAESLIVIYMAFQTSEQLTDLARQRRPDICRLIEERFRPVRSGSQQQNERSDRSRLPLGIDDDNVLHIVRKNMQNITPDKFFKHLRQLDSAIQDDQIANLMLDTFPQACRYIRDRLTAEEGEIAEEISPTAESDQQKTDQSISELIDKYSPAEYFAWFDENFDHLPRSVMVSAMTRWLEKQVGEEYGSLDANKKMASGTTARLNKLGCALVSTDSPDRVEEGIVSRLRCKAHPKYAEGVFFLRTVGANTVDHAYRATVPSTSLRPLPADKRRKI